MKSTTERRTVKIELNFPLTEGEKDFVRHLLDTTASVEDNGGNGAPTLLATPKGAAQDEETEAAPEPKAKAAPKAKKSAAKPKPEPVEEVEADVESVDNDDTDYIELATDKAVELVEAKEKDAVRDALKAVGVKRVSEVKDQDTAKKLYEALIA